MQMLQSIACCQSASLHAHAYSEVECYYPVGNYLFKVNNRNTWTSCQICSKLTITAPEPCRLSSKALRERVFKTGGSFYYFCKILVYFFCKKYIFLKTFVMLCLTAHERANIVAKRKIYNSLTQFLNWRKQREIGALLRSFSLWLGEL